MKKMILLTGMMISMLFSSAVVYHTNNCEKVKPVKLKPKPVRSATSGGFNLLPSILIKF